MIANEKTLHKRTKDTEINNCRSLMFFFFSDTTYTFVNGLSCEGVFSPNISLLAIGACALMGISNSAQAQYKDSNVAVNELRIAIFIKPKVLLTVSHFLLYERR